MTIEGADFSQYNTFLTPAKLRGLSFVWLRLLHYPGVVDDKFMPNYRVAKAAGVLIGAYSILLPGSAALWADKHVAALRSLGIDPRTVGHSDDLEGGSLDSAKWIARIQVLGFPAWQYRSSGLWFEAGQDGRWKAAYPGPPSGPFDIHQYSAVAGWGDHDRSPLTLAALTKKMLGGSAPVPTPPPTGGKMTLTPADLDAISKRVQDELGGIFDESGEVANSVHFTDGMYLRWSGSQRPTGTTISVKAKQAGWDAADGKTPPPVTP